jgi:hypothetical protein
MHMAEETEAPEGIEEETGTEEATPATTETKVDSVESRKWERRSKANLKEIETLKAQLKERETQDQSEHERAVAKAREEGESKARTEAEKERRADRLETAAIRLASKGLKIGAGDDAATVRFADPDDAFVHLERMVRRGDLDDTDMFDADGRVQTAALTAALAELLADKPHLRAGGDGNGATARVQGSADGGKGSGAGKSLADMTPAEHFERIRQKQ